MSSTHLPLAAEYLHQYSRIFFEKEFKNVSRSRAGSNASSEGSLTCLTEDGTQTVFSDSVSSVSSGSSGTSNYQRAELSTPPAPAIAKRRTRETRAKAAVKEQILAVRLPPPKPTRTHFHGRAQPSVGPTASSSSSPPAAPDLDYTLIPEELEPHVLFGWRKRRVLDYFGYPDDIGVPEVESRLRHYGPGKFASLSPSAEFKTDCFQDSMPLLELRASLALILHVDENTK